MQTSSPAQEQDSQATSPRRRRNRWQRGGRWLLLSIIIVTSCSLLLTLALFWRALSASSVASAALQVQIQQGSQVWTVRSSPGTVADLLQRQGIEAPPKDAISPPASAQLEDGLVIRIQPNREVTILADGEQHHFSTRLENPLEILRSAGIPVSNADKIWVNGALAYYEALPAWTVPAAQIEIRRSAQLTIIDDGAPATIETTAETVGEALFEAGITLYFSDQVQPALDSAIADDLTISIKRAIPIELLVDGVLIEARSKSQTVAEALVELNAPLFGLDFVRPPENSPIKAGMTIEILRVTEEILTQSETIAHETLYQADPQLELDQRQVIQPGKDGTREIRSLVRYENGIEVSRAPSETVEREAPQNQIIAYGTKILPRTVQTPTGPQSYWRALCMLATSYNPTSNGGNTLTATGETLRKGIVAGDPKIIAYGTEVYVPGYGTGLMADTAGYRSSPYWIDLGYSDEDYERDWLEYVQVYLLLPAPDRVNYLLPAWTPNRSYPGRCS